MTGLEQLHQRKRDDETDSGPFEASQNGVKHPGPTVAQATAALNSRKLSESTARASATFKFLARSKPPLSLAPLGAKLESFAVFLRRKWVLAGNALTAILRFVYARLHD
jgi:hypothetical protein